MKNDFEDPRVLRLYLLGALDDEVEKSRIEELLIADDEIAEQITTAEEALIEEYLDGELGSDDTARFKEFFLAPPQRKRQLRLTEDLRTLASRSAKTSPKTSRSLSETLHPLTFRWLRFAVVGVAVVAVGLAFWRFAYYEDDTAKGIAQLQGIYRDDRPFRSRVTVLPDYAPYSETRGAAKTPDPTARDRAQRYLFDATANNSDARAHHALGMFYLTGKEFDKARAELDLAVKAVPDDAKLRSDVGAALLEISKDAKSRGEGAKSLRILDESLGHLDRAIALDPKLLEARFNKALALQELMVPEQAKLAWREYLALDSTSKWADEARGYLQTLEEQTPKERAADELEADFLTAFRSGDDATASRLIAENRELIREKYLPQRLAMSYTAATDPDRRDELLRAMQYAGKLELNQTGDSFATEIARFYLSLPPEKLETAKHAQNYMRYGYRLCLSQKYGEGLEAFQMAKRGFEQVGNTFESKLALYFVGYGFINTNRGDEAYSTFVDVKSYASTNSYSWLHSAALYWIANSYINAKEYTKATNTFENAINLAKSIGDSYGVQRNSMTLAYLMSIYGQHERSLKYLRIFLDDPKRTSTGLRHLYRNTYQAFEILSANGLFNASLPFALDGVALADREQDAMWMVQARAYCGIASERMGEIEKGRKWLAEAEAKSTLISDGDTRTKMKAFCDLKIAELELEVDNPAAAEPRYLDAGDYYDRANMPLNREAAHRGLLRTYLALGRTSDLESGLSENIRMTEELRTKILEEDVRTSYFDDRGNIYDVAAEFEFNRNNLEAAYDYAELSSSRSLLDRMERGFVKTGTSDSQLIEGIAIPKRLSQIRSQMPANSQIVQYSVLDRRIFVWLISHESFVGRSVNVSSQELTEKVRRFRALIAEKSAMTNPELVQLGAELYSDLIQPVREHLEDRRVVCLIPNKVLFDLPFSAILSQDGRPLIAEFEIVYSPSANVYIRSTENAAAKASGGESILVVGNPAFDRERFSDLSDLGDAAAEAVTISNAYIKSKILKEGLATKAVFLRSLEDAEVVHFAGHYVVVPGAPMLSYLVLAKDGKDPSDGVVTNLEMGRRGVLRARVIVLAACDTGVEAVSNGEGMAGISRTFLASGVPVVIASHWKIDSGSTSDLMTRFHGYRSRERLYTTAALRKAQLDLLNDPSGKFSSPFHWAAFAAYGGQAAF